jgi:hypothetical protein
MFSLQRYSGRRISRSCPCRKTRSPSSTALRSMWSHQRGLLMAKKLRGKSARMRLLPGALRLRVGDRKETGPVREDAFTFHVRRPLLSTSSHSHRDGVGDEAGVGLHGGGQAPQALFDAEGPLEEGHAVEEAREIKLILEPRRRMELWGGRQGDDAVHPMR